MITINQTLASQYLRDGKKFRSIQDIIDELEATIEAVKDQRDEAIEHINELEDKVNELEIQIEDLDKQYYDYEDDDDE